MIERQGGFSFLTNGADFSILMSLFICSVFCTSHYSYGMLKYWHFGFNECTQFLNYYSTETIYMYLLERANDSISVLCYIIILYTP